MEMQLFLVYKGRFSWLDVDTMPIYELIWNYTTLISWKKQESEALKQDEGHSPSDLFGQSDDTSKFNEDSE